MKRIIFIVVIFFTVAGCKAQNANNTDFAGDWYYQFSSDQNPELNQRFILKLNQSKRVIKGRYCAISRNGNKIDCSKDKSAHNIKGKVKQDTAFVKFEGFYDKTATGNAKLYFKTGQLVWKIYESSGEIYAPNRAILNKKEKAEKPQYFRLDNEFEVVIKNRTMSIKKFNKLITKNDHIIRLPQEEKTCSARGYTDIKSKGSYFTIEQQNCHKKFLIDEYTTFKYMSDTQNFFLHKIGLIYRDRTNPSEKVVKKVFTQKDLGKIRFDQLNIDSLYTKTMNIFSP